MQKLLSACFVVGLSLQSLTAQTSNAIVGGTITDDSGSRLPAVNVTATNTRTGISTNANTNTDGIYTFPSLQPGVYSFSASLPGFITQGIRDVVLGSTQERINFKLSTASETQAILASGASSVSDVLSEDLINRLPLVGNDAMSLLDSLPGIVQEDDYFGGLLRSFGGLGQITVHTTRDGVVVSDARSNLGAFAATVLHPDWVGEIRLVLSPADAEAGTGNAQVRIQTRSGTNQYSGSATWNIRNSALNAKTWTTNKTSATPDWYNNHEYAVAYGGPIVKNRTFFYALWDQQFNYQRILTPGDPSTLAAPAANALTAPARNGIFRYYERWFPGNALTVTNPNGQNPTTASVDLAGNPVAPLTNPDGSAYTGGLRCFSVFGNVKFDGTPFTSADCPGGSAVTTAAPWDSRRPVADPTGYVRKIIEKMPLPNYFGFGDGLNRAQHRWIQRTRGSQGIEVLVGRNLLTDRDQLNLKIDDNISRNHRLNVGWTLERNDSMSELPTWPGALGYPTKRRPQVLTAGLTSSLSSTLLNEGRFGIRLQDATIIPPWESTEELKAQAAQYMIPGGDGRLAMINAGAAPYNYGGTSNGVMTTAPIFYVGGKTTMYSYADTLSWTSGKHAFRGGAEYRVSDGLNFSHLFGGIFALPFPRINGGAGGNASPLGVQNPQLPNMTPMARTHASSLLYLLAGSVNGATMTYWADDPTDLANGTWENTQTKTRRNLELKRREWSAFVKDDWKVTRDLTLNLGLRYEYYGSPYLDNGLTTTTRDQGNGLFGTFRTGGGNPFDRWLRPGNVFLSGYGPSPSGTPLTCVAPACDINTLTVLEPVGPNSINPSRRILPVDDNNFGPAIGFAWRLPWLGEGKTTIRGGYQITFGGSFGSILNAAGGPVVSTHNQIDSLPGTSSVANLNLANFNGQYLDLTSIPSLIPIAPTSPATPGRQLTVYPTTSPLDFHAWDSNYVTPYVQNFNLSVSRTLTRNAQLDVRYIGTIGRKQTGIVDLNTPNVYHNQELFDALELTRAGGNALLFDQMFAGLNLNSNVSGYGPVGTISNGTPQTGSSHLRRSGTFGPLLANGNYPELARLLNANGGATGFMNLPAGVTGVSGRLLRNGCDRLAAGQTTVGSANPAPLRCFPEDYLRANPQLEHAYLNTNSGSSNYHSMQTQIMIRQKPGLFYTGTYTWSKSLGIPGISAFTYGSIPYEYYTDPSNQSADYAYTSMHRTHDFRGSATADLPFGPGRFLFRNSSGWLARLTEHWQTSVIFSMSSGGRASIDAGVGDSGFGFGFPTGLYGNSVPDVLRKWPSFVTGDVQWTPENGGTYFGDPLPYYPDVDPQCAGVTTLDTLRSQCSLQAMFEAFSGEVVLQNPKPGTHGTFGQRRVELAGNWNLDANVSKAFEISESSFVKRIQLRFDATNVLNHPRPLAPDLLLNSSTFGLIPGKGDQIRSFQGQLRVEF
ncbi:MAG TPA: carboxypeptidase-like regulatory domain-containing protein [Terriglobia bacterium]|nr:carboxypeptidase-like regulatory domain-containing protein [Terriglobia bacterium]